MTYYIRRSTIFFDLYWPLHHTYWSRNVFVFLIKLAPVASWDFDTVPISLCPHHLSWSGLCGPSPQLVVHWPCYPAYLICPERSQKIIKASLARIRSSTTRKDSLTWRQHWFGAWVIIFYFFFLLLIFCTSNSVPGCYSIGHKVFSRRCGFISIAHPFFFFCCKRKIMYIDIVMITISFVSAFSGAMGNKVLIIPVLLREHRPADSLSPSHSFSFIFSYPLLILLCIALGDGACPSGGSRTMVALVAPEALWFFFIFLLFQCALFVSQQSHRPLRMLYPITLVS